MSTPSPQYPLSSTTPRINRVLVRLSKHWLAVINTFFFLYVGLPLLAPILLANEFTTVANRIYWIYHFLCHQFPSRAYFIAGEQVALCHRCTAIYVTMFMGGLLFNFVRRSLKPISFKWYLFFILPMAFDGGLAFASELAQFIPMLAIWIIGLIIIAIAAGILYSQKLLTWQGYFVLACGLLVLLYLQYFGSHTSNVYLRTLTGFTLAIGTIWFVYPTLEPDFGEYGII